MDLNFVFVYAYLLLNNFIFLGTWLQNKFSQAEIQSIVYISVFLPLSMLLNTYCKSVDLHFFMTRDLLAARVARIILHSLVLSCSTIAEVSICLLCHLLSSDIKVLLASSNLQ